MIPADLHPRWRQLPALAWLAAGRFQPGLLDRPVLHRAGQAANWPIMLSVLAMARGRHTLAAWHTRAVVIVQELPAGRHRVWQGWAAALACMPVAVAAAIAPFVVLTIVAIWLAQYNQTAAVLCFYTGLAEVSVHGVLLLVQVVSGLATSALLQRRRAQRWARGTFDRVAEVTTLAAHPGDQRAATRLGRPL
ncbi:hypothetical protein ABT369_02370 [Dactylosporangium sp. NPDC000244]|uniref:hypothetical protein n=1 Tax=Dactylosporangium sp. NPDC000244 TaxID=3154365 RepID=UPI003333028D